VGVGARGRGPGVSRLELKDRAEVRGSAGWGSRKGRDFRANTVGLGQEFEVLGQWGRAGARGRDVGPMGWGLSKRLVGQQSWGTGGWDLRRWDRALCGKGNEMGTGSTRPGRWNWAGA